MARTAATVTRFYLEPHGLSARRGGEPRLAGGWRSFSELTLWGSGRETKPQEAKPQAKPREPEPIATRPWGERRALVSGVPGGGRLLSALTSRRQPFLSLDMSRPWVMGVVNVTPDSFSDGGVFWDPDRAVAAGLAMSAAGAAIIDVGGESTRPGAAEIPQDEEQRRVLPVVRALAAEGVSVSIDSRRAAVMAAALSAGAQAINDVSGLTDDPASLPLAAAAGCPVFLMHRKGRSARDMQRAPRYRSVVFDVYDRLAFLAQRAQAGGIAANRIALDPGIGFGKLLGHNLALFRSLAIFHGLGFPILLGASRKSFISALDAGASAGDGRLGGSLAAVFAGLARGVQIFRVHDVRETVQAVKIWRALEAERIYARPTR